MGLRAESQTRGDVMEIDEHGGAVEEVTRDHGGKVNAGEEDGRGVADGEEGAPGHADSDGEAQRGAEGDDGVVDDADAEGDDDADGDFYEDMKDDNVEDDEGSESHSNPGRKRRGLSTSSMDTTGTNATRRSNKRQRSNY